MKLQHIAAAHVSTGAVYLYLNVSPLFFFYLFIFLLGEFIKRD